MKTWQKHWRAFAFSSTDPTITRYGQKFVDIKYVGDGQVSTTFSLYSVCMPQKMPFS